MRNNLNGGILCGWIKPFTEAIRRCGLEDPCSSQNNTGYCYKSWCPSEKGGKTLLLKTPHTLMAGQRVGGGKPSCNLRWKLVPCLLDFTVPKRGLSWLIGEHCYCLIPLQIPCLTLPTCQAMKKKLIVTGFLAHYTGGNASLVL